MVKMTHKDVKLAPGDKVNVYDKSRDKNHAFHVYTEPDGNNTWYSVQDKDGEAIFDTGNQLTGDDLADFMNGKVVEVGLVDPDDPMIKDLAERSDVTDLAEEDPAASAAGAHEYQFTDQTGLKHDLWSDDGKSQYEHAVSDPNIKAHYQLTNIERDGKEIYNAKEAEAERERDDNPVDFSETDRIATPVSVNPVMMSELQQLSNMLDTKQAGVDTTVDVTDNIPVYTNEIGDNPVDFSETDRIATPVSVNPVMMSELQQLSNMTHKDVKLAPGDKVNVYDKSRDKNHAFHVYTEPDGNNTWYSVQDKDGEAIFDTGNQLTGDDLADFMNGKVVEVGLVDPDDPMIKDLAERSDVTDLAEEDPAASAAGAHEYQFTDQTGLKHDLWSDDGKSQYEHAVSDPNIKDHYQLTNIERDGKEIYNAKEAEAERERDEQALLHMDEPEQDDPSDDLPF